MFKHQGETRTLKHNLSMASLLSLVAGIVNVCGFLSVQKLTTNVTGHFAFLVDEVFNLHFWEGLNYFFYIFFFFLGSFTSNFLVEIVRRNKNNNTYVFPILIESSILIYLALFGGVQAVKNPNIIAFMLLFAMGVQNSLVTSISNSTVRTTHLTGLFTDLGIELSQLFFLKDIEHKNKLQSSIKLRITIISFFFLGGILAGVLYTSIKLLTLLVAGLILLIGLVYDDFKLKFFMRRNK